MTVSGVTSTVGKLRARKLFSVGKRDRLKAFGLIRRVSLELPLATTLANILLSSFHRGQTKHEDCPRRGTYNETFIAFIHVLTTRFY